MWWLVLAVIGIIALVCIYVATDAAADLAGLLFDICEEMET